MTTRHVWIACLVVTSSLLATTPARAERTVELGGFVGAHWFNGSSELGLREEADDGLALDPGIAFGVRMGVYLCDCLLVEGEFDLTPTSTRDLDADVFVIGWRAQALWHFLRPAREGLVPFILAGAGAITSSPADERISMFDTDLAFHLGAGVKMPIEKTGVCASICGPSSLRRPRATGSPWREKPSWESTPTSLLHRRLPVPPPSPRPRRAPLSTPLPSGPRSLLRSGGYKTHKEGA